MDEAVSWYDYTSVGKACQAPLWFTIPYQSGFLSCSHPRSPSPRTAVKLLFPSLVLHHYTGLPGRGQGAVAAAAPGRRVEPIRAASPRSSRGVRGLGATRARGFAAACGPPWPGTWKPSCPKTCCAWRWGGRRGGRAWGLRRGWKRRPGSSRAGPCPYPWREGPVGAVTAAGVDVPEPCRGAFPCPSPATRLSHISGYRCVHPWSAAPSGLLGCSPGRTALLPAPSCWSAAGGLGGDELQGSVPRAAPWFQHISGLKSPAPAHLLGALWFHLAPLKLGSLLWI